MSTLQESKLTCPHCWHKFFSDEAYYISRHPQLYGDAVLGDNENRRLAPHEITTDRAGDKLDPLGTKITERACPVCHLQIPQELLTKKPHFISLAGCPGAGKTYFLTSMIHQLRRELALSFALTLNDSDSHEVRAFHEYERSLFHPSDPSAPTLLQKTQEYGTLYNEVSVNNQKMRLPKPFIFTVQHAATHPAAARAKSQNSWNLVLYDNAGESFDFLKDKEANVRVTQHLGECDALMFVFDPLQVPQVRSRLEKDSSDPQVKVVPKTHRQDSFLTEVINRMRRYRGTPQNQLLPLALVVCVQKYDVWKSLVPFANGPKGNTPIIDQSSVNHLKQLGIAGLDLEEVNCISLLVRAFLHDLCPEFVTLAESAFKTVRYFPVSALGGSPTLDDDKELRIASDNVHPFRVTHPMLWLLRRWKLVPRTVRKSNDSTTLPLANVQRLNDGRLRVVSPLSSRALVIDDEYEDSRILDPEVGQWLWIPKAIDLSSSSSALVTDTPSSASSLSLPPAPKAPVQESQQLKLGPPPPQPPAPPKRGWFKK